MAVKLNKTMNQLHSMSLMGRGYFCNKLSPGIRINEWISSFMLFVGSLTIVTVKILHLYGHNILSRLYSILSRVLDTKKNTYYSNENSDPSAFMIRLSHAQCFNETLNQAIQSLQTDLVLDFYHDYGWLLKAVMGGLIILSFTWIIIYKDSSVPGVNPSFPLSPSKKKFSPEKERIQINYLIGIVNSLLIFLYMCLD